jgi:hypothetical protein
MRRRPQRFLELQVGDEAEWVSPTTTPNRPANNGLRCPEERRRCEPGSHDDEATFAPATPSKRAIGHQQQPFRVFESAANNDDLVPDLVLRNPRLDDD